MGLSVTERKNAIYCGQILQLFLSVVSMHFDQIKRILQNTASTEKHLPSQRRTCMFGERTFESLD